MSCNQLGVAPDYSGLCLAYVQDQLGLPHQYPTAAAAWSGYASQGASTASPQPNDLVFFLNGGAGHVGICEDTGCASFRSVWSDGQVCDSAVQQFAADNGDSVAGYISTAAIGGHTGAPAAVTSSLANVTASGVPGLLKAFGLIAALVVADDLLEAVL